MAPEPDRAIAVGVQDRPEHAGAKPLRTEIGIHANRAEHHPIRMGVQANIAHLAVGTGQAVDDVDRAVRGGRPPSIDPPVPATEWLEGVAVHPTSCA